jgi:hypothetical protein
LIQRILHTVLTTSIVFCAIQGLSQRTGTSNNIKSNGIGIKVKSNGLGIAYHHQTNGNKIYGRFFYADFGSFKHTNESKIINHKVENKLPFVYGKLFHTARFRTMYGLSYRLVQPRVSNHVAVDVQAGSGLTLGIQRPVYLRTETLQNDQKTVKNVKYSRHTVPNAEPIIGYAKNGEGWRELSYRPGVAAVMNIAFSWNESVQVAKRLNLGVSMDYYPGGLPIMAFGQNPKLNASFYVGFMWVINQG